VTTLGKPQGDSFSPSAFNAFLEWAKKNARKHYIGAKPTLDIELKLPDEVQYVDDLDLISTSQKYLKKIERKLEKYLGKKRLVVNKEKTQWTRVSANRKKQTWTKTKVLGSLLGCDADVKRRKQLATVAFRSLWSVWKNSKLSTKTKMKVYNAYVMSVLPYNCGTWGLTQTTMNTINTFHRKQLRQILRVYWPKKISNDLLYEKTNSKPLDELITERRWTLLGHVLRLDEKTPAQMALETVLNMKLNAGRHKTGYLMTIKKDVRNYIGKELKNSNLAEIKQMARCGDQWLKRAQSYWTTQLNKKKEAAKEEKKDDG
jgi:hypothetical protein